MTDLETFYKKTGDLPTVVAEARIQRRNRMLEIDAEQFLSQLPGPGSTSHKRRGSKIE